MSHVRSDEIYKTYQDSVGKLDHFITGAAVALVGYLGTRVPTATVGFNPPTLELVALALFVGSAYCGVRRLERHSALLGTLHRHLHENEAVGAFIGAAATGKDMLNENTGQVHSPSAALRRAESHKLQADALESQLTDLGKVAAKWFRWRDRLFIGGLVVLALARLVGIVRF